MHKKIVEWIKKEIKNSKARGVVLGLSGGVDSALVAALAKEAVGAAKVLALFMPIDSQASDLRDAKQVGKALKIQVKSIDLFGAYDSLLKALPLAPALAKANLKPRLRMLALYYFANKLNYLVLGTGNKSELSVGYFTKYGDGAADILPIGGLLKKEVRRLAERLGIPRHIIHKAPTAGLWQGQTDEGEIGIAYPELDDILQRFEKKQGQLAYAAKVKKVKAMIKKSAHKRQGPKVCCL